MRYAGLYLLALPLAAGVACAASVSDVGGFAGESGGGVAPSGTFTPPTDMRVDCQTPIDSYCSLTASSCVATWTDAQLATSWTPYGCARIATRPCAGFLIAEPDPGGGQVVRFFYAADSGALVAIVDVEGPGVTSWNAGPQGFTNPLILDCEPPFTEICAVDGGPTFEPGSDADATSDSGYADGAQADGGLTDGARDGGD